MRNNKLFGVSNAAGPPGRAVILLRLLAVLAILILAGPTTMRAADADIILNEVMYHPSLDQEQLQYVELFNRGLVNIDLAGWRFTKGLKFTFPSNTTLAAGSCLVVCRDRSAFSKRYGPDIQVAGEFTGKLSHGGEKIELANAGGTIIDSIVYSDQEPWPTAADGRGASLERICPFSSGESPDNWAASPWSPSEPISGTPGRGNANLSTNLPPVVAQVQFPPAAPNQAVPVTAEVSDPDGVRSVTLIYWGVDASGEKPETELAMTRTSGHEKKGTYQAVLPAQPRDAILRFRIRALDQAGATRLQPSPFDPRPTWTYATFVNTNNARIAFAYLLSVPGPPRAAKVDSPQVTNTAVRPNVATNTTGTRVVSPRPPVRITRTSASRNRQANNIFVYVPPANAPVQVFDYVLAPSRSGGFKVHFQKDRAFQGMTGINILAEGPPRWVLSEPLAYEVYHLANVPAPLTEHLRVWRNGRLAGYHLMVEQPNKAFLARNQRDTTGNLYKLLWYGSGIKGQHEKKTNLAGTHDDLVELINGLNAAKGADQWSFIQKHFNVEEFINYYAVNMCIQNWDGFHNNYFTYHDTGRTGLWEIYPWDEDKTWGDYDGASEKHDWYEMPLTTGMAGDTSPRYNPLSKGNSRTGNFGGVSWWRAGGWFSAPLLANPEFRRRFLARLRVFTEKEFREEKLLPIINAMEKRLEPEIEFLSSGPNPVALKTFHDDMQSFRDQVKYRRQFILKHID